MEDDLPFFLNIRNQVKDKLHDSREFTLEEAQEWLQKTPVQYWIISNDLEKVGYFRLARINESLWQIGADIHPDFQRKGIASKAYPVFIDQIVKKLNPAPSSLELRVLKNNSIAMSLYLKLGFEIDEETEIDYRMILNLT
jgi:RimJ/RimL family protein N-acetyltransferase